MMKYGKDPVEHRFSLIYKECEPRGQWLDLYLDIQAEGSELPRELTDPGVLVICNKAAEIVQIVLQDEGCDCEFQFTLSEKSRVETFVAEHCQSTLAQAAAENL